MFEPSRSVRVRWGRFLDHRGVLDDPGAVPGVSSQGVELTCAGTEVYDDLV
jgi:hypothetical protein